MNSISNYFQELTQRVGQGWNRFWMQPSDPLPLCVLRAIVGLAGLVYLGFLTPDLTYLFGTNGILPVSAVQELTGSTQATATDAVFYFSYLNYLQDDTALMIAHALGMVVLLLMTVGCFTRAATIASFVVLVSYANRAPMITEQFELVLTMLALYLCIGPAGKYLSVDRLLASKKKPADLAVASAAIAEVRPSYWATLSVRLIQVHLVGLYLMMGLSMLGGTGGSPWWNGTAVLVMIRQTESTLIPLTWLAGHEYLVNAWTHEIVWFSLVFGLLVWNRLARPILLVLSVPHWLLLAVVTGKIGFCGLMLLANIAFIAPSVLHALLRTKKSLPAGNYASSAGSTVAKEPRELEPARR